MKKLITTPIFYCNAQPHIGHAYSALTADALRRWIDLSGDRKQTILVTGTDEHGLKIAEAAKNANMGAKEFCDKVSKEFRDCFDSLNISYDDFIRTTEDRHKNQVQKLKKFK